MRNLRPLWTCFKRGHIFMMSNTKSISIEINEIRLIVIWRKNLELLVCYSDASKDLFACSFFQFLVELEIKDKLRGLRTQYTREKQKIGKPRTGTGADEIVVSKWNLFPRLHFLEEHILPKTTISNLSVIQVTIYKS